MKSVEKLGLVELNENQTKEVNGGGFWEDVYGNAIETLRDYFGNDGPESE